MIDIGFTCEHQHTIWSSLNRLRQLMNRMERIQNCCALRFPVVEDLKNE